MHTWEIYSAKWCRLTAHYISTFLHVENICVICHLRSSFQAASQESVHEIDLLTISPIQGVDLLYNDPSAEGPFAQKSESPTTWFCCNCVQISSSILLKLRHKINDAASLMNWWNTQRMRRDLMTYGTPRLRRNVIKLLRVTRGCEVEDASDGLLQGGVTEDSVFYDDTSVYE